MIRPDAAVLLTKRSGESDVRVCRQPVGRDGPVVCDELLYGPSFQAKLTAARDVAATPADLVETLRADGYVFQTDGTFVDNGKRGDEDCRSRMRDEGDTVNRLMNMARIRTQPSSVSCHDGAPPPGRTRAPLVGLVPSPAQASRAEDGVSVNLVETVKAPGGLGVQPRRPGVACGVHEATGELRCTAEGCTANQYTSGNCPFRATTDPAAQFQLKAITATVDEARGEKRSHFVDVSACVSVAQLDPQSSFGRCAQERVRYELSKGLGIGECSAKDAPCRRLDGAREGR